MKRSTLALILALIGLAVFAAARLALYFLYHDYFAELTLIQLLKAFAEGARFDASVLFLLLGPSCVMLMIPLKFRLWRPLWALLAFAAYMGFGLVLAGDVVYFGYVGRHLANELYYLGNELGFIAGIAWEYKLTLLALFAGLALLGFLYSRLFKLTPKPEKWLPLKIFIALVLVFIMVRGSFATKPISSIDAYRGGIVQGNLIINGVFTTYRYRSSNTEEQKFYMSDDEAFASLGLDISAQYPLLKDYPGREDKLNVVVLIMESWSAYYISALNGGKFNVTPNFDRLARDGALFTRHYAPAKRSIDGIQAILTGIPPIYGIASMGFGLEIKAGGNLGQTAAKDGYSTVFMQTSKRGSFYMDAIAEALGFESYYGMEDIPLVMNYPKPDASAFGWDYDALNLLGNIQKDAALPFLSVFFSGTTHTPFPPLPQEFMLHKDNLSGEDGFLNTLYYADYSLGRFIDEASKESWFKDTVFIITADHTLGKYDNDSFPNDYNVPLLIYSPGNVAPGEYDYVTSHIDLLPTIMELSGMRGQSAVIGRNVFDNVSGRRAYINEGLLSGLVKDGGWVRIKGDSVLLSDMDTHYTRRLYRNPFYINILMYNRYTMPGRDVENEGAMAQELMAFEQVVDVLVNTNRWSR